ncbi:hypothetical protein [Rhodoligotrophos defluvii]|uniref:hypothetical protein n=1 Tax=Rhodoligotrophos defluvii TaxID=2561934 RepID=UPI0010C9672F|nr:hypothetical protein [Rhodoligotrophos defluvii]
MRPLHFKIVPLAIAGLILAGEPAKADTFWQDQPRGQPGADPAPDNTYSWKDNGLWGLHTGYGHVWLTDEDARPHLYSPNAAYNSRHFRNPGKAYIRRAEE